MSGGIVKSRGDMDRIELIPEIAIVNYEGAQAAAVLGITDILQAAERLARKDRKGHGPTLRISHWRQDDTRTTVQRTFDSAPTGTGFPTVVVIPPALGDPLPLAEAKFYADWLRAEHSKGAALCSVCRGAFMLGETGLLSGRRVTTHWTYEEQLLRLYPDILINTDMLMIDDGDIVTTGGVMSWIDLSLLLIERFLGPKVMLNISRIFLVDPPGRQQSYYSAFSPRLNHGDRTILKVQHWLQKTQGKEMSLAVIAQWSGLEQRTFMRRFRKATGHTTGDYVQRLRMNRARDLLQTTRDPIDTISWKVQYRDPSAFRKIFTRIVGLSPAEFRRRFHGPGTRTVPAEVGMPGEHETTE